MSEKKILRYDKKKGHCTAPYSVNIAVTERCPLKCPFCFQKYDHYHELSYQMVQKYIDEISSLGTAAGIAAGIKLKDYLVKKKHEKAEQKSAK